MVALAKAGGRLKLGLHPDVTAAVKVTGLYRVLDTCDETSALAGVWRPSWGAEWKAFSAAAVAPCPGSLILSQAASPSPLSHTSGGIDMRRFSV